MTTVKLTSPSGDHTLALVADTVRAWSVEGKQTGNGVTTRDMPQRTVIYLSDMPHPFSVYGDHDAALTAAREVVDNPLREARP